MLRRLRVPLAVLAVVAVAAAGEARAQWGYGSYPGGYGGYGRYGWGGWGGGGGDTVQGSIARGLGFYAAGVGQYNLNTAQANAINADTSLRWNQYWWEAQVAANRRERERLARLQARDSGASAAVEKRIREEPLPADIESGDALNAALDQITDPRVHTSALRLATTKIPGQVVRAIPFVNASEAVSISLDQLTDDKHWPLAFRDPKFEEDRKAYSAAVDKALAEDVEGDLSAATIAKVREPLARLKAKLVANPPADKAQYGEALNYLKSLYGFTRMLEKPDIEKVVAELDTIKETTLGSLLGFMHTFNLRFGRPTTPPQKAAYTALWPQIDALRDRIVAGSSGSGSDKDANKAASGPRALPPPDFTGALGLEHLEGPHRVLDKPGQ
jgi:hypothetical protein